MTILFAILLILSISLNIVFFWYIRKILQKLSFGVDNIDQLQGLLEEYCSLLESMLTLDQYYGDDTVVAAVKNTKLVIETCKVYKKTIIEQEQQNIGEDGEPTNNKG